MAVDHYHDVAPGVAEGDVAGRAAQTPRIGVEAHVAVPLANRATCSGVPSVDWPSATMISNRSGS